MSINVEPILYDRIEKNLRLREKLNPLGWPKPRISSYCVHLIEMGLKAEEAELEKAEKDMKRES